MIYIGKTQSPVKSLKLEARILRACKCGRSNPADSGVVWAACPRCGTMAVIEDVGVIAYWHRNPIIRLFRKILHAKNTRTKNKLEDLK